MSEYVFDLYIAGHTARSKQAVRNMRAFCEKYLKGNYYLNVIDVLDNPQAAEGEKIIATPTLIQRSPCSGRRFIGVLSNFEDMLQALGLDSCSQSNMSS